MVHCDGLRAFARSVDALVMQNSAGKVGEWFRAYRLDVRWYVLYRIRYHDATHPFVYTYVHGYVLNLHYVLNSLYEFRQIESNSDGLYGLRPYKWRIQLALSERATII